MMIKQEEHYEAGAEHMSSAPSTRHTAQRSIPVKTPEQRIASATAANLEDGDVKGAVRILCSDDMLAVVSATTLE